MLTTPVDRLFGFFFLALACRVGVSGQPPSLSIVIHDNDPQLKIRVTVGLMKLWSRKMTIK